MKTLGAYGEIAKMSAALSGAVPQIAVVDGLCAGTAAMIACMADVVIMTEKSELFMTAPFTADDKTAGAGTAENAAKSGVAAILAKDSDEAIAKAKQLLSVLPANNLETAGNDYYMENDAAVSADLKGIELISSVADKESVIELYKQFGTSAVTAIGSLNWRTAGFVATNNGAKLTADDSAKIARFVTLCDAYSIPVVTFVDSEGFEKSSAAELAGSIRDSAKLAQAYASATTAKIAVVTGKAYGSAYVALASTAAGSDFTFAWEGAVIAPTTPEAAVVFYNLRTLWCQHKPEVKAALKGPVFVVHSLNCGQEYLFGAFLCDFGRVVGVRRNRSHSACIESLVAVKSTLVVHGRSHGNYGISVGERENGNHGTR